jgi:hypothetical protein
MAVVAGTAILGSRIQAQELVPTPDPIGGVRSDAAAAIPPGTPVPPGPNTEGWRYRWYEGRWWYWTPENRWMWYSDDGRWVAFEASHPPAANAAPMPDARYLGPGVPYTAGYPGVAVGVRPYGNVNVAVGRRVGVDVYGPHGSVRVGRIFVGW